ncbi:MAG: Holliday junction branch migration protein RuvA [Solirubrobacteraceae bacterium]
MITLIKGEIEELNPAYAVINCSGVGYHIAISLSTFSSLQGKKNAVLHTKLIVREDAHLLYGFGLKEERELFNLLISVAGVGPASGLITLSTLSIQQIINAIQNSDSKVLESVKGIGSKTAQKIVIDLKDKINKNLDSFNKVIQINNKQETNKKKESLLALESLGVSSKQVEKLVDVFILNNSEATLEEIIKGILKNL